MRAAAMVAVLLLAAASAGAQANEHERLGVEPKEAWEATIETGLGLTGSASDRGTVLEAEPTVSLNLLYAGRWSLSLDVPASARIALRLPSSPPALVAALGDPRLSAGWTARAGAWRLGAELSYCFPLGVWEPNESSERGISSGSGFHKARVSVSALRFLDPIAAGIKLGAETWLGRRERFGLGSRPLVLSGDLFFTEALNSAAALSAGLAQRFSWPRRVDGVPVGDEVAWSLSLGLSLALSFRDRGLRIGIAQSLTETGAPASLEIGFSWTIRKKE